MELLELCAIANGGRYCDLPESITYDNGFSWIEWNPLEYPYDLIKLQVKFKISVKFFDDSNKLILKSENYGKELVIDDMYFDGEALDTESFMYAVVRIVAEIGKDIK